MGLLLHVGQVGLAEIGHVEKPLQGHNAEVPRHGEVEGHSHGPQSKLELANVQDLVREVVVDGGRLGGRPRGAVVYVELLDGNATALRVV